MNNFGDKIGEKQLALRAKLLGSLLLFTKTFFRLLNNRELIISNPIGRESHVVSICRDLTKIFKLEVMHQSINMPPGWGKSVFCKFFIAWCMGHYADCNFLYISKDHDLAANHTADVKRLMSLPLYQRLFNVRILHDSNAKDYFKTEAGGVIAAFGSGGGITGYDAGLPGLKRFSGAVIIDDIHKPDEIHSTTVRNKVIRNYHETIRPRLRGDNVPILAIGQRLHEDDFFNHIYTNGDGHEWNKLIIKALSDDGYSGYPEFISADELRIKQQFERYSFYSQQQQMPIPAGGSLFKAEDFVILPIEPTILATFITCDTAETTKQYNDATVFSFWGLYKIEDYGMETNLMGLHWIDCMEIRVEPRDLESHFLDFYVRCMRHNVKPQVAAIEKKSTGVTLISILKQRQGLIIVDINRDRSSGTKGDRFINMQKTISSRLISFTKSAEHLTMCIDHCQKITANDTHRHDDIADTLYDAIKIGLWDNLILGNINNVSSPLPLRRVNSKISELRSNVYGHR